MHTREHVLEQRILEGWGESPLKIDNFFTEEELVELNKSYPSDGFTDELSKIAGVWRVHPTTETLDNTVHERLSKVLPYPFTIKSGIFKGYSPTDIHDDMHTNTGLFCYKFVNIVLSCEPVGVPTRIVFFKQRNLTTRSSYRGKHLVNEGPLETRCEPCYDYSHLLDLNGSVPFDRSIYDQYLFHNDYQAMDGLTFDCVVEAKPGTATVFDMGQLHGSGNWAATGQTGKIMYICSLFRL